MIDSAAIPALIEALQSAAKESQMSDVAKRLLAVRAFLSGSHALDGHWFGDDHPSIRGRFWWRQAHLPVLDEAAAEIARLQARLAAAEKLADALSAAIEYMTFHSTMQCEPYPLDKCRAALSTFQEGGK